MWQHTTSEAHRERREAVNRQSGEVDRGLTIPAGGAVGYADRIGAALYAETSHKKPAEDALKAAKRSGFKVDPLLEKRVREMQ